MIFCHSFFKWYSDLLHLSNVFSLVWNVLFQINAFNFSFSNFTKDNLSKSGLTVYRKSPHHPSPPPKKKKKIPNNNGAQGHLRAMSVIRVVQHRSFLNDKKKWIRWQFNMRNVTRKYFHRLWNITSRYISKMHTNYSPVFISQTSYNQCSTKRFFPSLEFTAGISATLWQKWQLCDTLPEKKANKESEKLCGITIVDSMRNYPASVTSIFVFID